MQTLNELLSAKDSLINRIKRKEITQYNAVREYNDLSAKIHYLRQLERAKNRPSIGEAGATLIRDKSKYVERNFGVSSSTTFTIKTPPNANKEFSYTYRPPSIYRELEYIRVTDNGLINIPFMRGYDECRYTIRYASKEAAEKVIKEIKAAYNSGVAKFTLPSDSFIEVVNNWG